MVESVDEGVDLPSEVSVVPGRSAAAGSTARARRGVDTAAFDVWVDEVGPDLLRFARITTRNLDPADLVQEALVAVFLRWSRLGDAGQADAYARRVILNGHVSRWRKWGRRVTVVDPAAITEVGPDEGSRSDDVVTARQLLGALPVTQRAAVFMRFYDDLTYREIAAVIGCREAMARSYVHRALTQLRHQLDGSSSR